MNLPSIYRWDNTGAPAITSNNRAALVSLLRACLVDGFGQQSVSTMTHATGVVTVTTTAVHNLTSFSRQTIAGANEAGYNGTYIITVTGTSTFTYVATGITDASATGTLTTETAGAGWTMPHINLAETSAAFRNDSVNGTGFFLQVDGAGGANDWTPLVMAYEAMTDWDAGTNPFYTTHDTFPTGSGSTATSRPWILVADDRAVYLWAWCTITANPTDTQTSASALFFGDIVSWHATDSYAAAFRAGGLSGAFPVLVITSTAFSATVTGGMFMPRASSGAAGTLIPAMQAGGGPGYSVNCGALGFPYTSGDPILVDRPYFTDDTTYSYRGPLPGFYRPCHGSFPFPQWSIVDAGTANYLSIITNYRDSTSYKISFFIGLENWRA